MGRKELIKRYILFVVSLFVTGLGVAIIRHGNLGLPQISAMAGVLSHKFTSVSFGTWVFLTNCLFLVIQILLLRKRFPKVQYLQLPLSLIYGIFTDIGVMIAEMLPNETYAMRISVVVLGTVVLGFGVAMSVVADVLLNSTEGIIQAFAIVLRKDFGSAKVMFDLVWVGLAAIVSLLMFDGRIYGIREGTVISMILVGTTVKAVKPLITPPLNRFAKR